MSPRHLSALGQVCLSVFSMTTFLVGYKFGLEPMLKVAGPLVMLTFATISVLNVLGIGNSEGLRQAISALPLTVLFAGVAGAFSLMPIVAIPFGIGALGTMYAATLAIREAFDTPP